MNNYPLALAQVSKEILIYNGGIDSYFVRRNNNSSTNLAIIDSDITQNYNYIYQEVLNMTLKDIELKDKESAKVLYMLALLPADLTKEFLMDLFGLKVEEKLIALGSYRVIQAAEYGKSHVLNIHDVIREEAVKRLNSKNSAYREETIQTLLKRCKAFYAKKDSKYFNELNAGDNQISTLHAFIDIALQNDLIDDDIIKAIIIASRLNSGLFNKYADYSLYQQLAAKIYHKNLNKISPIKKALLFTSLMRSDYILGSPEALARFEKEMLLLLDWIKDHKNYEELFYIDAHMALFYLSLGDFREAKKYLEKAKKNISYVKDIFSLLRYWYVNAWLCYELRDLDTGMDALNNYTKLGDQILTLVSKFFARDLKIKFEILMGQKDKAKKELQETIKEATVYFNNSPANVLGELEYTKTLLYFNDHQYDLAEKQANIALNSLEKVFGKDIVDQAQAHVHVMLGAIYEDKGNYDLALKKYEEVLRFYDKTSSGRVNNYYEYGELLSNLCNIYYRQKNYPQSKFYFRKLTANFGIDHEIVDGLIKKLPHEYMLKVNNQT